MVIYLEIKKGIMQDNGISLETLSVDLGNTTLLLLSNEKAFAMCGALNVGVYDTPRMVDRKVCCMRCVGVKTLEELYNATIVESSEYAKSIGVYAGMKVCEAFKYLSRE